MKHRFGPPARASMYVARNMHSTRKAKQANCDHVYEQSTAGRSKDAWVCVHCGKIGVPPNAKATAE